MLRLALLFVALFLDLLPQLPAETFPGAMFLNGHRHHRHHHRRHRHHLDLLDQLSELLRHPQRRTSLATTEVTQSTVAEGIDDLLNHPEIPEEVDGVQEYKIHPLVGRQIKKMDGDLQDLAAAKMLAEKDQAKLGDVSADAAGHMSQGVVLKRSIVSSEAAEHALEQKLNRLGKEGERITRNKDKLQRTLTDVMEPKIEAASKRVEAKKKSVEKARESYEAWAQKQQEYKNTAVERLSARKAAAESLKAADDALADAQKEETLARDRYETSRKLAGESVEQFRYVETRFQAVKSKVEELEPEVAKEEKGLGKMKRVLEYEAKRLDEAEARQQQQLKRIIEGVEKQHADTDRELLFLNKRYSDWQQAEQERAAVVAQRQQAYKQAVGAYQEKHSDVYKKAEAAAAKRADTDSDWGWDDWAWSGGAVSDPQDEEVHIADQ